MLRAHCLALSHPPATRRICLACSTHILTRDPTLLRPKIGPVIRLTSRMLARGRLLKSVRTRTSTWVSRDWRRLPHPHRPVYDRPSDWHPPMPFLVGTKRNHGSPRVPNALEHEDTRNPAERSRRHRAQSGGLRGPKRAAAGRKSIFPGHVRYNRRSVERQPPA